MKTGRIVATTALAASALVVITIGTLLVHQNILFGQNPVTYGRLVVAALALFALIRAASFVPRPKNKHLFDGGVESLAALLAVAAGIYGLSGLAMPSAPTGISAPSCNGELVNGTAAQVVVSEPGLTVRQGATTAANQVGRLPAGCAIGISGFCPGRPIKDFLVAHRVDSRWFELATPQGSWSNVAKLLSGANTGPQFVASGRLQTQISSTQVQQLDPAYCQAHLGTAPPGPLHVSFTRTTAGVAVEASADRVYDYGFVLYITSGSRTGTPLVQLPASTSEITSRTTWTDTTLNSLLQHATQVTIAAFRCWGSGAPVLDGSRNPTSTWSVNTNGVIGARLRTLSHLGTLTTAAQVACQQYDA